MNKYPHSYWGFLSTINIEKSQEAVEYCWIRISINLNMKPLVKLVKFYEKIFWISKFATEISFFCCFRVVNNFLGNL
jgi:hypothetical protein